MRAASTIGSFDRPRHGAVAADPVHRDRNSVDVGVAETLDGADAAGRNVGFVMQRDREVGLGELAVEPGAEHGAGAPRSRVPRLAWPMRMTVPLQRSRSVDEACAPCR